VGEDRRAGEIIHRLRNLLSRGEVSLQPVDVNEALEELLRLARNDLLTRRITVSGRFDPNLPRAITDRVQLQQVALNLIVNGCDAMAANPPERRELTITTFVAQDEIRVGVLDRGTGLPGDVESLFLPFHTTKADGLGMGLAICRTLVTAHKGRLWAEHREGGGAAFHVALPLAQAEVPTP
jgi:C4-dicarboxylate-specific signal transduction histidine kinase